MQTQREIRQLLESAGLRPRKRFGQNFLIDRNLMEKLLALAEVSGNQTVLEVGSATGSLTEELVARAGRVVAIEIDRGLFEVLRARLGGRENLTLLSGDVLAGKHTLSGEVLAALGPRANLAANLPYHIATPLVAECLVESWRAPQPPAGASAGTVFERLTFTVQQEVADRFAAAVGSGQYGPVSVVVALLGRLTLGPAVPATAFWPRPNVAGRMVRIDFDAAAADALADVEALQRLVTFAFSQRRKQLGSLLRRAEGPFASDALAGGMKAAGINPTVRPQNVTPEQYGAWSNALGAT